MVSRFKNKDTKINRIYHAIELHKNDIKTLILMPKHIQQTNISFDLLNLLNGNNSNGFNV